MGIINNLKEFILEQSKKDYTPYLILSIPLLFLVIFLVWPLGMSIVKAFVLRGNELILNKTSFTPSDVNEYVNMKIGGSPLTVGRIGLKYYLVVSID